MASVKIHKGPIEPERPASEIPQEDWIILLGARRSFAKTRLPYDCRELLRFVDEAELMAGPLGFKDASDLIKRGLELDPALVDWAVRGLKTIAPDSPIPFSKAVKLGKRGAPQGNKNAAKNKDVNHNIDSREPMKQSEYRLARLERDHPKIHEAYHAGELPSVAAAWRAAGLEKPKDALKECLRWYGRLSEEQRESFWKEVGLCI